jgi:hypothetical protein
MLAPVAGATYHSRRSAAKCFLGTRRDVIAEIARWANDNDNDNESEHNSDDNECNNASTLPICWLSGPAGYGKSAISHAIAEHYDRQGRLVGNFFFFRGGGDRSIIRGLVPTLSHQLYHHVQAARPSIQNAIETNPHITTMFSTSQFQKLIIEPILVASNTAPSVLAQGRLVMVIDGLDECNDKDEMRELIEDLIRIFQEKPGLPLRILITSRVEEHIQETLETPAARSVVHRLSLLDFDARPDIRAFFKSRLSALYDQRHRVMRDVPFPWPSEEDLDSLAKKSDGSFLFAATLIDLISQRGLPQVNLQAALTSEGGLDSLYTQILADVDRDENFERVISTVMLLTQPIPIVFLAHLLQLQPAAIVQTLLGLQSVLLIPGGDDEPIRVFHTSLRDFLTSPGQSGQFFINPPAQHLSIAVDCLRVLAVQPQDGIFYGDKEVYACLNWHHHFLEGITKGGNNLLHLLSEVPLLDLLTDFASRSLAWWLNTFLLKGRTLVETLHSMLSNFRVGVVLCMF